MMMEHDSGPVWSHNNLQGLQIHHKREPRKQSITDVWPNIFVLAIARMLIWTSLLLILGARACDTSSFRTFWFLGIRGWTLSYQPHLEVT